MSGGIDRALATRVCEQLAAHGQDMTQSCPLPGGVIAVTDATGAAAVSTFGVADIALGTRMRPDHLFQIGSISKAFVGLLTNIQIDAGRLTLDTPVPDILPWVEVPGGHSYQLTVGRLLNHTSGLVTGADAITDDLDQAWVLRNLAVAPAGRFHYSNAGFVLLGLALEELTGQPVRDLVEEQLCRPMGMSASTGAILDRDRARHATGHQPARRGWPWMPGDPLEPAPWSEMNTADGHMCCTAADLSRLAVLFLTGGAVAGGRVVSTAAIERMVNSQAPDGEPVLTVPGVPASSSSRYGHGINVEDVGGQRVLSHGGGMVGYSTFFLTDLDAGVGIVVLTNANGDRPEAERLARLGHAALTRAESPAFHWPSVEPRVTATANSAPTGTFVADEPGVADLVVRPDEPSGLLQVEHAAESGWLFRDNLGRYGTDHPELRDFRLQPEPDGGWQHGPRLFRPAAQSPATPAAEPSTPDHWAAVAGRYRSYSPWYPVLRIYVRCGRLFLAAPGGVEAPPTEEELVEVGPGTFRIGAEPWLPERLTAGAVVNGRCVYVDRDGCRYSRTFLP